MQITALLQAIAEISGIVCLLLLLKALQRGADEARLVTMQPLVPFVDLKAQFRLDARGGASLA